MESSGKWRLDMKSEVFAAGAHNPERVGEKVPLVSPHDERHPSRKFGIPYVAVVVGGYGDFHLCVSLAS